MEIEFYIYNDQLLLASSVITTHDFSPFPNRFAPDLSRLIRLKINCILPCHLELMRNVLVTWVSFTRKISKLCNHYETKQVKIL